MGHFMASAMFSTRDVGEGAIKMTSPTWYSRYFYKKNREWSFSHAQAANKKFLIFELIKLDIDIFIMHLRTSMKYPFHNR